MTTIITVSSKNQITLPVKFVKHLKLSAGTRMTINLLDDNSLVLEPFVSNLLEIRKNMLKNPLVKKYSKYSVDKIIKMAGQKEAKRIADK